MSGRTKAGLVLAVVCGVLAACGDKAQRAEEPSPARPEAKVALPDRSDAIGAISPEQAREVEREHVEAGILAADSDDPNRWAPSKEAVAKAKQDAAMPLIQMSDDGTSDISLGSMPRPPVPPQPPKLANGDEADQFGLPAWEEIARGDLKVKRIQY